MKGSIHNQKLKEVAQAPDGSSGLSGDFLRKTSESMDIFSQQNHWSSASLSRIHPFLLPSLGTDPSKCKKQSSTELLEQIKNQECLTIRIT